MGIADRIKVLMKRRGLSAYSVSTETGVPQSTLSRILNRDSKPNASNLKVLADYFKVDQAWLLTGDDQQSLNEKGFLLENSSITGFYFPSVSAAAGMDKEMFGNELEKIPIYLPTWEKGIDFINVYGDSMYPKFCSGEIIGIKEVELQYINYGYAYVVILTDGQVLLKFIKKGVDKEHIILESENKFYESKEYRLSQIRKVFIIKGVITKTTM